MKKLLLSFIGIWTIALTAAGQQTPETALLFTSWPNLGITATLTDSSFGPVTPGVNYGNLGNTGRCAWTFLPICDTNEIQIFNTINYGDTAGLAVFGPFQDTTNIVSQLQAYTPVYSSFYQPHNLSNQVWLPKLQRGLYYIVWNIGHFTGSKLISGHIANPPAANNLCGFCNSSFDIQQNICLITLDSATQRNQLIWDKGDTANLSGFILFRENNISGQYDSLTFIDKDSANYYIDMTANPATRNWRYMMHRYDQCGNRLPSYYQGGGYVFRTNTIHLQQGVSTNNSINLSWNNYINNSPNPGSGGFIQSFYIYRSNGIGPFVCIDSVPSSNASYTDVNPNQGLNLYQVGMKKITPCTIVRAGTGESRSNIINTSFTGLPDPVNTNFFSINPNPTRDILKVEVASNGEAWDLRIINAEGKTVISQLDNHLNNLTMNCEKLAPGFYTVEVIHNYNSYFKKLIIN